MAKKKDTPDTILGGQTVEEIVHYTAILVEEVKSVSKMTAEKVQGMEERLIQRLDENTAVQNQRFDLIEIVLKQHSQKFQVLENKMDKVLEKVNQHEKEITEIKEDLAVGR